MNKKVLSAILFSALFAGTGTFTSCIDTDEPAGIEELRGAKAELIRAKVAVEQAEAAFKLAQAEVQKAEAARLQSLAKINEASARLEAARAEEKEIDNEEARAELEQTIAEIKQAMELAALEHETALIGAQEDLAVAKRDYENALKQIAIAEALMSEDTKVYLSDLKDEVEDLMDDIDAKEAEIADKQEELYHAAMYLGADTDYQVAVAEKNLKSAKNALTHNANTVAKYKKYLSDGPAETDWRAEVAEYEDSIALLKKAQDELNLKIVKAENSQEYKDLKDTQADKKYAYENQKVAKMYYKDILGVETVVDKGTALGTAAAKIYAKDATTGVESGFITDYKAKLATFTSEKKAVLDIIAADYDKRVADAKKISDEKTAAWTTATTNFAGAKAISTEAIEKAYAKYDADMVIANAMPEVKDEEKAAKAKAILKVEQTFADAIVAFYNTVPAAQIAYNNITLIYETSVAGTKKNVCVTKTAKEWLSDAENKDIYLNLIKTQRFGGDFTKFWKTSTTEVIVTFEGTEYKTSDAALKALKTDVNLLEELQAASKAAFGEASLYELNHSVEKNYMRVIPTEAEIKAVKDYESKCGALGYYYWLASEGTEFEAKNYEAIIADYNAAVTYWTEQYNALVAANAAAKAAKDAADKAVDNYYKANIKAYADEKGVYAERIGRLETVKNALIGAVDKYLQSNYADLGGEMKFIEWLKKQVASLEGNVIELEYEIAKAEADLKAAQEGHFLTADNVQKIQKELAKLEAELKELLSDLEKALADLKTAESIWAGTAAE